MGHSPNIHCEAAEHRPPVQPWVSVLSKFHHSSIVSEIQSSTPKQLEDESATSQTSNEEVGVRATDDSWVALKKVPWKVPSYLLGLAYQSLEVSHESFTQRRTIYHARIQLPSWLAAKAWDMQAQKAYDGWKILLRPWNVRPRDTDVFDYAMNGSMSGVLEELNSNRASIHDRDPFGRTLLHYIARAAGFKLFQSLMQMGLDPNETDEFGSSPLYYMSLREDHKATLALYRSLLSTGTIDCDIDAIFHGHYDNPWNRDKSCLWFAVWSVPGLVEIVGAELIPDFYQSFHCRLQSLKWANVEPAVLLTFLQDKRTSIQPEQFRSKLKSDLLSFMYRYFDNATAPEGSQKDEGRLNSWRALTRWIFSGVQSQYFRPDDYPTTFLFEGLWYTNITTVEPSQRARRVLLARLHMWLEDMQACGVDLEEYGRCELALFENNVRLRDLRWTGLTGEYRLTSMDFSRSPRGPKLESFLFGPNPEDWVLLWDDAVEELACEFWDMVEYRPAPMPGAWVEDED